jgi:phenylalanine-4-hydroxylase
MINNDSEDFAGQAQMSVVDSRTVVVELDQDHPGFKDAAYRQRRNEIAKIAYEHKTGMPVPDAPYTQEEDELWATILELLRPVHEQWACAEYLEYWDKVNFPEDRIPQMREVTESLRRLGGFSFEPVCGLVLPRTFLIELKNDIMLGTQYIRHYSKPMYTPEPDVVHELVGHGPMLAVPKFMEVNRLFGEVTEIADDALVQKLINLYWWSIEFGSVKEGEALKSMGAGLFSSIGELASFAERPQRDFEPTLMENTAFDPTQYQPFYFCGESTDDVVRILTEHLQNYLR